jgi:hypothetical protein
MNPSRHALRRVESDQPPAGPCCTALDHVAEREAARINIPALNTVRRDYLLDLARKYEEEVEAHKQFIEDHSAEDGEPKRGFRRLIKSTRFRREQSLKIAAIYREMADHVFKADDPQAISERDRLAAKLRAMTVANGCTEAEADTAQSMLWRLETHEAAPCL